MVDLACFISSPNIIAVINFFWSVVSQPILLSAAQTVLANSMFLYMISGRDAFLTMAAASSIFVCLLGEGGVHDECPTPDIISHEEGACKKKV